MTLLADDAGREEVMVGASKAYVEAFILLLNGYLSKFDLPGSAVDANGLTELGLPPLIIDPLLELSSLMVLALGSLCSS